MTAVVDVGEGDGGGLAEEVPPEEPLLVPPLPELELDVVPEEEVVPAPPVGGAGLLEFTEEPAAAGFVLVELTSDVL